MEHNEILIRILEQQSEIKSQLAGIQANLKEHMRRSAMLEKAVEHLEAEDKKLFRAMYMLQGALALIGIIGTILSLIKYIKI